MRGPVRIEGRARAATATDDPAPTSDSDGWALQRVTAAVATVTIATGTLTAGGQLLCWRKPEGTGATWARWQTYDLVLDGGAKSEVSPEMPLAVSSGRVFWQRVGVTGSTTCEVALQTEASQ